MIPHPPISTPPDTLFPGTTLFRSSAVVPRDFAATMARPHPVDPEPLSAADDGDGPGQRHRRTGEPGFQTFDVPQVFILDHRQAFPTVSRWPAGRRSEEHTSELQSLMRISYAVFCLNKKKTLR